MTPEEIKTLCTNLNGGAPIDDDLLQSLLNQGRTILFSERDWVFLRKTNTAISVTQNNDSWNTAVSLATITDFFRFFNTDLGNKSYSIALYDSGNDRIEYFRQVPFSKRLEYKNVPNTFCYDRANHQIYFNSDIPFSGVLYINYLQNPTQIDIITTTNSNLTTSMETAGTMPFLSIYHPIVAYYAIGINKGAVDYDSINREMLPNNQAILNSLKNAMEKWDTNLQLDEQMGTDPTGGDGDIFVSGRVNMNV
jgi:hypothetical protein